MRRKRAKRKRPGGRKAGRRKWAPRWKHVSTLTLVGERFDIDDQDNFLPVGV